jgi:hypothetical protein
VVSALDAIFQLVGRIVGLSWLSRETDRADLTAGDYLLRGSVIAGVFAVVLWLIFR